MFTQKKGGGKNPIFENVEIILENINEGLYITLETKFRSSMSIIKDFKIFTPPKKRREDPILKISKFNLRILLRVAI